MKLPWRKWWECPCSYNTWWKSITMFRVFFSETQWPPEVTSVFCNDTGRLDWTKFSWLVLRIEASATLFPSVRQVDCGWNVKGIIHDDIGFMWFPEYWFPCKIMQNLCVSFGFKHLCFPPFKKMLQPPGLLVFQIRLAQTQHRFEGDVQNRQDEWV